MNFSLIALMNTFLLFFSVSIFNAYGQKTIVKGRISDEYGAISGVNVYIKDTSNGTQTTMDGVYELKVAQGTHTLVVSYTGYSTQTKTIILKENEALTLNFTLARETNSLANVEVLAKTEAQKLRETSYAIEVIETEQFKNTSTNGNEILAKVPGVNIRQSGGLGSDFKISLNGLSDNQVRMFIDGVPMDYFGTSLSLNNFSANLIEQIEIYKGVVPIHLSSDALGGAINISTNKGQKPFLDASYSYGSFNTHIASLNGQYRDDNTGFTAKLKSFYNYSDNNYDIDLKLINFDIGRANDFTTEVERFNDAYESKMGWFEAGFTKTKFADQLFFGILYSDNVNELQYDEFEIYPDGIIPNPYGEVYTEEQKIISNFNYSKKEIFTKGLSLNTYFVNVISEEILSDTGNYDYDWFGNRELSSDTTTGESAQFRKTFLTLQKENILGNISTEYAFNDFHNIAFNYSLNSFKLQGEDDYNTQNSTQFADPSVITKQVLALSYSNSLFDKKFSSSLFSKYYKYVSDSVVTNYQGNEVENSQTLKEYYGFGVSTTYKLGLFQLKASFENALRFPDIIEIVGDGFLVNANTELEPETSKNYNLGLIFNNKSSKYNFIFSTNAFIRDTRSTIQDTRDLDKLIYVNWGKSLTKGIDLSASYNYDNKILFNLATTYTAKRDNDETLLGQSNSLFEELYPNQPYLYGNASLSYNKKNLIDKEDSISLTISENYVHSFFYTWSALGENEEDFLIPEQWVTNIDFVYSAFNQKYNISFGIINAFDSKVYDNYFQQRPGRSFNLKIRYFLN